MRPRGWHLLEKHFLVDGAPIAGALFDFGLFFFHNAAALVAKEADFRLLAEQSSDLENVLWIAVR